MNRRTFVETLGGIIAAPGRRTPAAAGPAPDYYLLETYYLRDSTQGSRLHQYLSQGFLPAVSKFHSGLQIFLDGLVAAHMPQCVVVLGLRSLDELTEMRARLRRDPAFQRALAAWRSGGAQPPCSRALLKAADYAAAAPPLPAARPGIFELRTYHSPARRQLGVLHQRLARLESGIFHRCGIHPIIFSQTLVGPDAPNLTYLTPFPHLAAREQAWAAFGADPAWIRARSESMEAVGQVPSVIRITLLRATPYSPTRLEYRKS